MEKGKSAANSGIFSATVCKNRQIGTRFYRLSLEFTGAAADTFAVAKPGQFAQIDLRNAALPKKQTTPESLEDSRQRSILLRRPFSFCDVTTKGRKTVVEILYCVAGPATCRMTSLSTGASVSVIGPLGNGFWIPEDKKSALLVVGGMGAGPLIYLTKLLTEEHIDVQVSAFAGAKTASELPFERRLDEISQGLGFSVPEFGRLGVQSLIATDDGTAGYKGFVTDCFSQWLDENKPIAEDTVIYTCGPEQMLMQISRIAQEQQIDCQLCMERRMACGFGVCQSCVVECKGDDSNQTEYKLCCKDGPVFDSREVIFKI